jgi:aminopeptidase YwaD
MSIDWRAVDRWIMGEAWVGSQIESHLGVLCDQIGVRWAGTQQERQAAVYVATQLEALGMQSSRVEEFPLRTAECNRASLAVIGDGNRPLDVRPCLFCPGIDVDAPLVDVGFGMPHELERIGDRLSGAIALLKTEYEPFSAPVPYTARLNDLEQAGVVAAITPHAQGGRRLAHIAGSDWRCGDPTSVTFPLVQTSREDGGLLRRIAAAGGRVRLTVDSQSRMATSWNSVAELRGSTLPDESIVIGAHHDTTPDSCGANDDGSGVAVLLETARLLAAAPAATGVPLPMTLRFVTFGAEEQGLQGSTAYVERHHGPEPLPRLMFNLDELATGPVKGVVLQFPDLREQIQQQLDTLREGFQCHVLEQLDASGDMFPFTSRGVPAAFFWRWRFVGKHPDSTFGHGSSDTLEKVRIRELKEYAGMLARLLARLAALPAEQWPENRLDPERIAQRLDAERGSVFRTM